MTEADFHKINVGDILKYVVSDKGPRYFIFDDGDLMLVTNVGLVVWTKPKHIILSIVHDGKETHDLRFFAEEIDFVV